MPPTPVRPSDHCHAWASPGEWDWTVHAALFSSLLLCGSMLFATASHTSAARQPSPCVRNLEAVYRMFGPSTWGVLRECHPSEALY